MCGIAGIFDLTGRSPIDRGLVRRMSDAISHRGPDGDGYHFELGVGLAHRRLAIIDVAGGQQPLYNEDESIALVYNGELYNYRDLIPELARAGHVFQTRSDTEVIVHAWEEWGPDCLTRFRGMFAFALYDRKQDCLFLARDRLGKKPLYYTVVDGRFLLFASELKALLAHPSVRRTIDPVAVDDYLAYGYVPDPLTIYSGIHKLPPAHSLMASRGRPIPAPQCYWRLSFGAQPLTERDVMAELPQRLAEAAKIRLMSEVPLGAFLSGGVDSSGIVAMVARESDTPLKTFAIGFGEGGNDELAHAARVAQRYGTDHRTQQVDVDPLGSYRAQAAIFDEPFADSSAVPTHRVCQLARRHVTVALSGDAGDELFAGYRRYRMHANTELWRRMIPDGGRKAVFGTLGDLYPKLDWAPRWLRAKYTLQELAANSATGYYRTNCRLPDALRLALYSQAMRQKIAGNDPSALVAAAMDEAGTDDPVAKAQYADIKTYLAGDILAKVDRASMAVSLEVRVPMLDHQFVEWAAAIPSSLKIRKGEGKYVLKRALEPYVPHENLYRPKQGFATPLAEHFRSAGGKFVKEALLSEAMLDSGYFDAGAIERLIDTHMTRRFDHSRALYTLLMFDGFLRDVHFSAKPAPRERAAVAV